ncbi:ABC transporter permease [Bacillus cytotoxicus]|uniref:ABC transporter permease n=1 Tax=unclassified Bacillus cereus group TaxID=2750818 RepID=UPI001F55E3DC|nr:MULTISPECIES: ABC transporter permease [unclassified Bacillus cereus group]EMA6342732.1 ABC transporter permease [Bacillus cytotoxicus]
MLKLMKLEWRKHHLSRYFTSVAICIVAIFAVVSLMAWGSKVEEDVMFSDYAGFMSLANIFIRITFIIFAAVMLSRLIIDEYKNKTMQLLFVYPLQRKTLIQAKLAIVFGFCFVSTIMATFLISILLFFLNPIMGLLEVPVTISDIIVTIPATFINGFMIAGISLVPLYFGMRKKSTPTTITSATIIGFLVNGSVGDANSSMSLFDFIIVPIVLCILGFFISYFSYRKVDKADVS